MVEHDEVSFRKYRLGRVAMKQQRFDNAIELFKESLSLSPHFKALECMGECFLELGRYAEAIVPLAAASALNDQLRAQSLLALALLEFGDSHGAARIASRVVHLSPGNKTALDVLRRIDQAQSSLSSEE